MNVVALSLILLFVALSIALPAPAEDRAPVPARVPAPVPALVTSSSTYDIEACFERGMCCCGCLVTIKMQQNPERTAITWMSFIYDDGVQRDAIRYGKKVQDRPDLMLEPIRVESCATPLAKVSQYQYTGDVTGLGYAYVFWFNDCLPPGGPHKVVVRKADVPLLPANGYSLFETSFVIDDPSLRIFKLFFEEAIKGQSLLTGGETVAQTIVCG
jgi:hypothetical protein